jgi:putative membrane protein
VTYLWVKAFHIIAVVCWFAALFYLPRLFVYHAMSDDKVSIDRFKIMERKLYRGIMTPSAIIAGALGIWLISLAPSLYMSGGWFHAKISMVLLLVIYHVMCGYHLKRFRDDINTKTHVYFRWFNEAPVLLLIGIIIMVVVKPF